MNGALHRARWDALDSIAIAIECVGSTGGRDVISKALGGKLRWAAPETAGTRRHAPPSCRDFAKRLSKADVVVIEATGNAAVIAQHVKTAG
jgi:hypothetical protein